MASKVRWSDVVTGEGGEYVAEGFVCGSTGERILVLIENVMVSKVIVMCKSELLNPGPLTSETVHTLLVRPTPEEAEQLARLEAAERATERGAQPREEKTSS